MGALWSSRGEAEAEWAGPREPSAGPRAIDLREQRPYDPPRSGARQVLRFGVWVGEDGAMGQLGMERLKRWVRYVLHTDDTPPRAALAFALGVFIAWTPVIGFHTLLALGLAFLLGLNRLAVLAGTFVNNPWTFVPIYSASAYLGSVLLGTEARLPRLEAISNWSDFAGFFAQLQPWIVPLTAGTLILGSASALLSFPIVLYGIRWYRGLRRAG